MKPSDLLSFGLGAAFLAKDAIKKHVDELEKRGELNRDEAKRFYDEAVARAKQEEEALDAKVREKVKEAVNELGLATKADIEELKELLKNR